MNDPMTIIGLASAFTLIYGVGYATCRCIERSRRNRYQERAAGFMEAAQSEHQLRVKAETWLSAEVEANKRLVRRMNEIRESMEQPQRKASA